MEPFLTVIVSVLFSGVVAVLVSYITNWKLEEHKAKLALTANDQLKRRQLFEEVSTFIEDVFGGSGVRTKADLSLAANKLFGKLALIAPDDVYLAVKGAIVDQGVVLGKEAKPPIYCALRKSLFGEGTKLECRDFVPHCEGETIPEAELPIHKRIS